MSKPEAIVKTPLMKRLRPRLAAPPYAGAKGLLLAVSGGMDSMALLDALLAMRHVHGAPVRALYVHHGSGPFADRSQALVEAFCQARGAPLTVRRFEPGDGNFEYEAAAFRKQALLAAQRDGEWLLLAHHLQDQTETFFQTIVRGAGAATPPGMAERNGPFLRPLLDIDRALIAEHAAVRGVPHVLDPTNFDKDRFRSRLRVRVTPHLRDFHEGFEARLHSWIDEQRQLIGALDAEAAAVFGRWFHDGALDRAAFREAPGYLWDFLLKRFWAAHGLSNPKAREHRQVKHWLAADATGWFDRQGVRAYCDLDALAVMQPVPDRAIRVRFGEEAQWGPWRFCLCLRASRIQQPSPSETGYALVPCEGQGKAVRDFLRRARVPHRIRAGLPLFQLGGRLWHYYHLARLVKGGYFEFRHISGPTFKPYFENVTPETSSLFASLATGAHCGISIE